METNDLLELLYAAEVRKLAVQYTNHETRGMSLDERERWQKDNTLNPFVIRAHEELQRTRQLIAKHSGQTG